MDTVKYGGIADAHGIESFIPFEEMPGHMQLRAASNRQRHALVFVVTCTQSFADKVLTIMDEEDDGYQGALHFIKNEAKDPSNGEVLEVQIEKGREKSWNLIPNPDIDPWS
jgi:hypothetical protein